MNAPMTAWRGRVNELVYGVDPTAPIPDEDVTRVADLVIGQRVYTEPVGTYHDAAMAALTSRDALAPGDEDANVRDFLRRLADELAARHPWPEPPYRAVRDAGDTVPPMHSIGSVAQAWISVQQAVGFAFEESDGAVFRLLLRMASGALVELRGASGEPRVYVLTDAADVDAARAELGRTTGLNLTA
jgi:hypothetical protein